MNTYTDTWGKLVRILKVKRFANGDDWLISVEPDFMDIQYAPPSEAEEVEEEAAQSSKPVYTDEYYLVPIGSSRKLSDHFAQPRR